MIEKLKFSDIDAVVEIHIESFPTSFLTSLGRPALIKLYEAFLTYGYAYVYKEGDKVLGVMAGTLSTVEKFYQRLIFENILFFAIRMPGVLVKTPGLVRRIFLRIKRLFQKPEYDFREFEPEYDLIIKPGNHNAYALMLGVSPESRGKGVGKKLWIHQLHDLPERGVDAILASVDSTNEITNGFYEKMGFKIIARTKRKNFDLEYRWLAYWKGHCSVQESGQVVWE
ncbi:MAG: GNAT family N-acetyltransferase [Anaerolineales bacterium]|nr:GNAT family N-acetyltransferase [Anaerolineales bacterium]